ncbi:septum formation initiator family protein [bacterium]|nr:septum formation initiator family protein [bacterium]
MTKHASKRKKRAWILGCLLLLTLVLVLSMGKRGFIQQIRIKRERKQLMEEIEILEEQKAMLEAEKEKLDDLEYIEKIAREKYGMARENEDVYRVVPAETE